MFIRNLIFQGEDTSGSGLSGQTCNTTWLTSAPRFSSPVKCSWCPLEAKKQQNKGEWGC